MSYDNWKLSCECLPEFCLQYVCWQKILIHAYTMCVEISIGFSSIKMEGSSVYMYSTCSNFHVHPSPLVPVLLVPSVWCSLFSQWCFNGIACILISFQNLFKKCLWKTFSIHVHLGPWSKPCILNMTCYLIDIVCCHSTNFSILLPTACGFNFAG